MENRDLMRNVRYPMFIGMGIQFLAVIIFILSLSSPSKLGENVVNLSFLHLGHFVLFGIAIVFALGKQNTTWWGCYLVIIAIVVLFDVVSFAVRLLEEDIRPSCCSHAELTSTNTTFFIMTVVFLVASCCYCCGFTYFNRRRRDKSILKQQKLQRTLLDPRITRDGTHFNDPSLAVTDNNSVYLENKEGSKKGGKESLNSLQKDFDFTQEK